MRKNKVKLDFSAHTILIVEIRSLLEDYHESRPKTIRNLVGFLLECWPKPINQLDLVEEIVLICLQNPSHSKARSKTTKLDKTTKLNHITIDIDEIELDSPYAVAKNKADKPPLHQSNGHIHQLNLCSTPQTTEAALNQVLIFLFTFVSRNFISHTGTPKLASRGSNT